MDIEEFEKQFQPSQRQSKLEPFKDQILSLKEKKYSNLLICEWLKSNGVEVSQEAVRKFIKSRTKQDTPEPKQETKAPAPIKSGTKPEQSAPPEIPTPPRFRHKTKLDEKDLF